MPDLLLGPLLRYAGTSEATVWVETDTPCEVEVLGCSTPTFRVGDHHYALVHVTGMEPGVAHEYGVRLDGREAWPEAGSPFPPSVVQTARRSSSSSAPAASPLHTRRLTPWTSRKTPGASAWMPYTRRR